MYSRDGAAPNVPDPSEVDDGDKSILALALEACEDAIKTVECPSHHKDGEYRWHRLARMALDKARLSNSRLPARMGGRRMGRWETGRSARSH